VDLGNDVSFDYTSQDIVDSLIDLHLHVTVLLQKLDVCFKDVT